MKLSLCTITFRHHLLSLEEIAHWASAHDFQGIELWGVHARNLTRQPNRNRDWLARFGLVVPMISDYLPLDGNEQALTCKMNDLCRLAVNWGARKIRTFAGGKGSAQTHAGERALLVTRLRQLCRQAGDHGLWLVVETHPGTLADSLASTLRLIGEVDHPALKINFDTLHVWEGGDDPLTAHRILRPHIAHYHFKNVRGRADLTVFEPANVYAAAGRREGMTPLFAGAVDYQAFLQELTGDADAEASLEWFGDDCFRVLAGDVVDIRSRHTPRAAEPMTGT